MLKIWDSLVVSDFFRIFAPRNLKQKGDMARLLYEYLGYKEIPNEWFFGVLVKHTYQYCWYLGSEKVKKSDIKSRVEELEKITNEFGHKKYRNIRVLEHG